MKKGQATIRDIALKLNISISTVSRALRDQPEINIRTKTAVLEMAKKLNYEPNVVAQNLRTNKTNTIGVVVPDLVTHFFSSNISGIQEAASKLGYNVMICQSNESYENEVKNINILAASRVDGLLVSLSQETNTYDHLQKIYDKDIPLVLFDRVWDDLNVSKVIVDDEEGAFQATEHLIFQGRKNIAFISGPKELSISRNRLQGYLRALRAHNMQPREDLICYSNLQKESIVEQTQYLLNLESPPDAIFTINDLAAINAMIYIKSTGRKIPEDIALVGFSNAPVSALVEPSITTVDQPAHEMGKIAARHLLDQIKNPDTFEPKSIILKTKLIIRNSSQLYTHIAM